METEMVIQNNDSSIYRTHSPGILCSIRRPTAESGFRNNKWKNASKNDQLITKNYNKIINITVKHRVLNL